MMTTRLAAGLALALGMTAPALAHDPLTISAAYDPAIQWLDRPTAIAPGQWRIRMVHHGQTRQAFLNTNQTWLYQRAYERELTRLSFHMSVHRAMPRARHAAFHAVVGRYPNITLESLDRTDVKGARLLPEG